MNTVMPAPAPAPAPAPPRKLAAGRGTEWIGEGYGLFRQSPGTWIGILLIWLLISGALSAVPGLTVVGSFLNPVFSAGILLGCASLARSEGLRVEHLFAGFRSGRLGPLLMLTVWTVLLTLALLLVVGLLFGVPAFSALKALPPGASPGEIVVALGFGRIALVAIALATAGVVIAMATWFAVPLIVFRGLTSLEAMKASFRACLANWLPLTVYGLVMLVIFVLACVPLLLGLLVAVPVAMASVYTSYRDIFGDAPA